MADPMERAKELMAIGMETLRNYVPPVKCRYHPDGQHFHDCPDWDFLYICSSCPEFDCCTCYPPDVPVQIQIDDSTDSGEVKS